MRLQGITYTSKYRGALTKTTALAILIIVIVGIIAGYAAYMNYASKGSVTSTPTAKTTTTPKIAKANITTITDFRGKNITLEIPVERIIVLQPYWAEVLQALGAGDRIVGIGKWVKYDEYLPSQVRDKPVVGTIFTGVSFEKILALHPDVVITDYGYGKASEIISKLENLKVKVVGMFVSRFSDEIKAIKILGKLVGADDRAEKLIDFLTQRYNKILFKAKAIKGGERLRAVFISGSSILRGGALSLYANTSWGHAIEDAGVVNIALEKFPDGKWPKIDFETLAKWNPDIILISSWSTSKTQKILDHIDKDQKWHDLKAYRNRRIYVAPCGMRIGGVLDWGPRDIIGREYIASILYPEIYKDIDWGLDMEQLLTKFYGLSIPRQAFASYSIDWKEIVDTMNNTVRIPRKVSRVADFICYTQDLAFRVMDKLVAVSKYAKTNALMRAAYPNITQILSPGSSFKMNVEELASLKPQVVIIWPYNVKLVDEIKHLGIPVVEVKAYSINDIKRIIWMLGSIYDLRSRAKELINDMDYIIGLVQERVKNIPLEEHVRVLYTWSKPTRVQGGIGTLQDFITLAGGINVAAKDYPDKAYVNVDVEKIIGWNPDMIIIWWWARYNESTILENPQLQSIKAVMDKSVYKEPFYEHWGMDSSLFILWLAKHMYLDRFKDVSFMNYANKYYEKWYGVTYSKVLEVLSGGAG